MKIDSERAKYDVAETILRPLRTDDEHGVVIGFGAHRNDECGERGSMTCSITKSGHTATSEALHLYDAVLMARSKVNRMIEAEKAAKDAS